MKKLFLLALLSSTMYACSKNKDGGAPASIDGYWNGTFTIEGRTGNFDMAVVLRNNGTARILYGYPAGDTSRAQYITEDRFTYEDGVVKFQSRESSYIYSYQGTANGNVMSGTWGELPSYDDGGTWTMTKK